MLDYTRLYPHGFHPTLEFMTLDFKGFAKHTTRTRCWPRYYLIDFGRSRRYSPDAVPFEVTVPPLNSNRKTLLPEQGGNTPRRYNPFPVDIFRLGHMLTSHCAVVGLESCASVGYSNPSVGYISPTAVCATFSTRDDGARPILSTDYYGCAAPVREPLSVLDEGAIATTRVTGFGRHHAAYSSTQTYSHLDRPSAS